MIDNEKLRAVAEEAVNDTDKFIVDVKVATDNTIEVFVALFQEIHRLRADFP